MNRKLVTGIGLAAMAGVTAFFLLRDRKEHQYAVTTVESLLEMARRGKLEARLDTEHEYRPLFIDPTYRGGFGGPVLTMRPRDFKSVMEDGDQWHVATNDHVVVLRKRKGKGRLRKQYTEEIVFGVATPLMKEKVIAFLQKHPNSRSGAISKGLGLADDPVTFSSRVLTPMSMEGLIARKQAKDTSYVWFVPEKMDVDQADIDYWQNKLVADIENLNIRDLEDVFIDDSYGVERQILQIVIKHEFVDTKKYVLGTDPDNFNMKTSISSRVRKLVKDYAKRGIIGNLEWEMPKKIPLAGHIDYYNDDTIAIYFNVMQPRPDKMEQLTREYTEEIVFSGDDDTNDWGNYLAGYLESLMGDDADVVLVDYAKSISSVQVVLHKKNMSVGKKYFVYWLGANPDRFNMRSLTNEIRKLLRPLSDLGYFRFHVKPPERERNTKFYKGHIINIQIHAKKPLLDYIGQDETGPKREYTEEVVFGAEMNKEIQYLEAVTTNNDNTRYGFVTKDNGWVVAKWMGGTGTWDITTKNPGSKKMAHRIAVSLATKQYAVKELYENFQAGVQGRQYSEEIVFGAEISTEDITEPEDDIKWIHNVEGIHYQGDKKTATITFLDGEQRTYDEVYHVQQATGTDVMDIEMFISDHDSYIMSFATAGKVYVMKEERNPKKKALVYPKKKALVYAHAGHQEEYSADGVEYIPPIGGTFLVKTKDGYIDFNVGRDTMRESIPEFKQFVFDKAGRQTNMEEVGIFITGKDINFYAPIDVMSEFYFKAKTRTVFKGFEYKNKMVILNYEVIGDE
jgi:hypothetical protein